MPAECYWCKAGTAPGKVVSPIGRRGEAVGCCLKCQILACGDHSVRDNSKQQFKCWDCLFLSLIASAVAQANLTDSEIEALKQWEALYESALGNLEDTFKTFREFELGHTQLKSWLPEADYPLDFSFWPQDVQNVFNKLSADGQRFLWVAAQLLSAVIMDKPLSELEAPLKYYLLLAINNQMFG